MSAWRLRSSAGSAMYSVRAIHLPGCSYEIESPSESSKTVTDDRNDDCCSS